MKAIGELTRLDYLREELHCQREKILCLEQAASYISPAGDGGGRNPNVSDRVGKMAAQIADERNQLEQLEEDYSRAVAAAVSMVNVLPAPTEREALIRRYVAGAGWEVVAEKMGYSLSGIHKVKNTALKRLWEQRKPTVRGES